MDMLNYTGAEYEGGINEETNRFEGQGTFTYPSGTRYVGEFKNGVFHGEGTLYFPGQGSYHAIWEDGKEQGEGRYVFADGLEYDQTEGDGQQWPYCTKHDRRYWSEYDKGVAPAGREQVAADPSKALPAGCYDCGDGYFDPKQGKVFAWGSDGSGEALRVPTAEQIEKIQAKNRLNAGE